MRSLAANLFLVALMLFAPVHAAEPADKAAHQAAMQKLAFLIGDWEGSGSIAIGPGPRQTFSQTERIQFKHEGTLLLIEGQGRVPGGGPIIHDALAVMTFDATSGQYKFRSFVAVGRSGDASATVDGNTMVWTLAMGPRKTRYTITVEHGVWREIGETTSDEKTWTPFFEMTVKRK